MNTIALTAEQTARLIEAAMIITAEIECYCCDVGVAVRGACGKCHLSQALHEVGAF